MEEVLFEAIENGYADDVLYALENGADVLNARDSAGNSALDRAALEGHSEIVKLLLKKGADAGAAARYGWTSLHCCAAFVSSQRWYDLDCIRQALDIAGMLLENGANVGAKNIRGETPLHTLLHSRRGACEVATLFLKHGADVEAKNNMGETPLHCACYIANLKTVKLLVQHYEAQVEARSNDGSTPLIEAVRKRFGNHEETKEVVMFLLGRGAVVTAKRNDGTTALHWACRHGHLETIRLFLLDYEADLEAKADCGSTPLIFAARIGNYADESIDVKNGKKVVKFLLARGAEVTAAQEDGNTALHWACRTARNFEMIQLFLDRGAALEAKGGEDNDTPLHLACSCTNNLDVVKELVRRGADFCCKNEDKKTPFDVANRSSMQWRVREIFCWRQYKEKVWQREGRLSLHSILGAATYLENDKVQLPVGTITVDVLLALLKSIHSRNPDSIRRQDSNRSLPLHIACRTNAPIKVLRFFVGQDAAMLYMFDSAGSAPIHEACRGGASLEKIKLLVEKGGAVTLRALDFNAALPLHILCQSNPSVDVVKYMVQLFPISVSQKTSAGALPFMLACEGPASESVLQFLLTKHPKALVAMKEYYSLEA